MKMSPRKKIACTLAVGAIAIGAMLTKPAVANAAGNPNKLDQGDLTLACQSQYGAAGWQAKLKDSSVIFNCSQKYE